MRDSGFVYENLNRRVAEHLREEILWSGKYKNGQRIQEAEVADELNISRAPVREALRELEHQGIVVYAPRRGSYVAGFDHEDFMEIVDIRYAIESKVFEAIVYLKRLSPEDFAKLRSMIDEMVELSRSDSPMEVRCADFSERDITFHRYIWEKSGRKWSYRILSNLYFQLRLVMMQDMIMERDIERSARMHYDIVDCLENGDIEGAKEMLLRHIFALWKDETKT